MGDREDYYNDNPKAVPPESDLASAEALPEVFPPPLPEHNHPSKVSKTRSEQGGTFF